ncbi:hypothetical protein Scep_031024 [Stephania cephalantha]|uniref:Uncharacterized protein n=1 Tax=Stephania cephalantha TaxID=152367 RepID=A0AAP0DTY1_9MAGN
MHHLYPRSRRHPSLSRGFATCQALLGSFHRLSRVEPWDLTADFQSHLQTLYAQSFRITLASSVLPRLLAQS